MTVGADRSQFVGQALTETDALVLRQNFFPLWETFVSALKAFQLIEVPPGYREYSPLLKVS